MNKFVIFFYFSRKTLIVLHFFRFFHSSPFKIDLFSLIRWQVVLDFWWWFLQAAQSPCRGHDIRLQGQSFFSFIIFPFALWIIFFFHLSTYSLLSVENLSLFSQKEKYRGYNSFFSPYLSFFQTKKNKEKAAVTFITAAFAIF